MNNEVLTQLDLVISGEIASEFDDWFKKVNKEAAILAREFDRKKQAYVSAKAGSAMSGVLDVSKLSEYKFNEDLFSRTKVLPIGKNHKFYVILDWSGSMGGLARAAMQQTVIQAAFLRKLKIDHYITMFGFGGTSGMDWEEVSEIRKGFRKGQLYDVESEAVVLFDDKQSQKEYLATVKLCFLLGMYYGGGDRYRFQAELSRQGNYEALLDVLRLNGMGCTPLNSSLMEMYNVMWREHAVNPSVQQNLLIISDGDSHSPNYEGGWQEFAENSMQFEVDGKTKTFPPALLAAGFDECKRQTYGLISCFDWGVNTIFLFLDDHNARPNSINYLVGKYVFKNFVEDKTREVKAGKILSVKNLYGCIDEVLYVGGCEGSNLSDATLSDAMGDEEISEMSAAKFKQVIKKSGINNSMQHLSAVIGEALAKNYSLNKHAKGTKQNARAVTVSFDDKYWKNMTNWLVTEAEKNPPKKGRR